MQVEITLDANCAKTKIVIITKEITEEITDMANRLSNGFSKVIPALWTIKYIC